MKAIKVERHLALGRPYNPGMGRQSLDPEPYWHTLGTQVREAEALGFDTLVTPETTFDPFMALAVAALEPSKIELATGIALAFPRSPTTVAYSSWDLQRMTQGRFALGLGSQVKGHIVRRFGVEWQPAASRMKDYVQALRAVWSCWQDRAPLRHEGKYYNLSLMIPTFTPPPQKPEHAHIPVHIAAVNEAMLRVAGEVADGVRLHGIVTRKYMDQVAFPNLQTGADRAGRSLDDLDVTGGAFVVTGKDQAEVEQSFENARRTIGFYGSTRTYRVPFELGGWADEQAQLHELSVRGKWDHMAAVVTDEIVDAFCVVGAHGEIAAKMKVRLAGCTRFALDIPTETAEQKRICKEIVEDLHRPA